MTDKPRTGQLVVGEFDAEKLIPDGIELEPVLDLLEKLYEGFQGFDEATYALLREHGRLK